MLVSVIQFLHGKDPNELIHSNPKEFKAIIKNDQNIYDFVLDTSAQGIKLSLIEGKRISI
jgi:hypothetical protein